MKKLIYKSVVLLMGISLLAMGCSKKLVEKPYTVFTTDYLKTAAGLQTATISLYSGMRYLYGPIGAINTANSGTDEWTLGDQGYTNNPTNLELGTYTIKTTNGDILTPWNRSFNNINLANGILEFAANVSMDENAKKIIIAEAHFFRGLYYFLLVQQFGAVPIDLGSGDFVFNQKPFQGFNRLVPDLLKKNYQSIIEDFTYATQNLPDKRSAAGYYLSSSGFNVSKSVAYLMLSKAYLFRGYNNAVKEATDFKSAWDAAKYIVDNQAALGTGLLTDYADVHKEGNDYNQEILYAVERIQGSPFDNEVNDVSNEFSGKANMASNLFTANYQNSVSISLPGGGAGFPCDRVLQYMRPLRQLCPTPWVYDSAFVDKKYDSRYDNTFRTVWLATNNTCSAAGISTGDTAYFLAPSKKYADSLRGLGTKKYKILDPTEFYLPSRPTYQLYPSIKKFDDNKRAAVNDASGRPYIVSKLSEAYLLAAEAAILDNRPADALPILLTLRERAAFRASLASGELATRRAMMRKKNTGTEVAPNWVDLTTTDMTVDFVMTERTRELCGESLRWADLACRNLLVPYLKTRNRNPLAGANVQAYHSVRPIPQTQLDASKVDNPAQYQNTGY